MLAVRLPPYGIATYRMVIQMSPVYFSCFPDIFSMQCSPRPGVRLSTNSLRFSSTLEAGKHVWRHCQRRSLTVSSICYIRRSQLYSHSCRHTSHTIFENFDSKCEQEQYRQEVTHVSSRPAYPEERGLLFPAKPLTGVKDLPLLFSISNVCI